MLQLLFGLRIIGECLHSLCSVDLLEKSVVRNESRLLSLLKSQWVSWEVSQYANDQTKLVADWDIRPTMTE